jgi:CRP-like cAMP-binding protein
MTAVLTERNVCDPDSSTTSDVTRRALRPRKGPPQRSVGFNNHILAQLPADDREALLAGAEYTALPVGHTFARVGDLISRAYFPDTGVISMVSEMTTGHQVAVATVGAEGAIGVWALFGVPSYSHALVVLVESSGFQLPADRFRRVFQQSEALRRITLTHVGSWVWELATAAACNRVHSHRQRLARWLLITTDKAKQQSLPVTHEVLAQMVGGPRHAVTVALNELRARGAIAHLRGRIEILKRSVLVAQSCECYTAPADRARP